jgi:Flp pilus assembly protein TadG
MMTYWKKLGRAFKAFGGDRAGNVMITFALATLPIVGFTGFAVDYSHANSVKTAIQAAIDSTALMLSRDAATVSAAQLQTKAQNYFNSLFTRPEAINVVVTATYTTTGGSAVAINATADVPTAFLGVIGYNNIRVNASSTAKWGSSRLRVALVLDNTGSMADDGKMTALKSATHALLTQLQNAASVNGDVYVSIVPFSKDVNIGNTNNGASWIDWTAWDAANGNSASTFSGSVCISNVLYKVVGSSWVTGGSCTGTGPGICFQSTLWKWNGSAFYNAGTCSSGTNHNAWNGCITDRGNSTAPSSSNYDQNVTPPTTTIAASLYPAEQYPACPVAMMGLSYNWSGMNSLVDSMTPNGYTNQPIGLVWGWLTLAGGGIFNVPTKDSNYTYQEAIILMSDGLNTEDRWYVSASPIDKRMYDSTNAGAGTCANIKATGITIYSIQVNTGGDPTSTIMQNCASGPDKFWVVTSSSGLGTVFNQIGTNLTKLRVAN